MSALQKRFSLGSAVVIFNFMKMDMAAKTVEAAEAAMRCVARPAPQRRPHPGQQQQQRQPPLYPRGASRGPPFLPPPPSAHPPPTHHHRHCVAPFPPPRPPPFSPGSTCMDETEVATSIREVMSREYADCTWQVFVGRNFGSQVTYEETRYIYFYIGQVGFVVFSSN